MIKLKNIINKYKPFKSNVSIKRLIISDSFFMSGLTLSDLILSIFVIQNIKNSSVINLGIANSIFVSGMVLVEPFFVKFFDKISIEKTFDWHIGAALAKACVRLSYIFINNVTQFYIVFFIAGIVHSIEFPSFTKLFTHFTDKNRESSEWGYKDIVSSILVIITSISSGYIAVYAGYTTLFALSGLVMILSGVVYPLLNRGAILRKR